ncbi:MBL fold metallo-hydrolase [Candidatus Poribacteria bacterium]|nr:MBL fold metallo-hydrolase [Candidatus Poribacteria bacterium]
MKYIYLGGAGEVGASCLLIQVAGRNILIDCGIRVNQRGHTAYPDLQRLKWHAHDLDAVFISHAHADHIGGLLTLQRSYPKTPIFMTGPTADLATVMLLSAHQLTNIHREVRHTIKEIPNDRYSAEDLSLRRDYLTAKFKSVLEELKKYTIIDTDAWIDLEWGDTWAFRFIPSGHILGAVSIELRTPEGNFLYTGDVSAFRQRIVDGIGDNLSGINPDFMWCESTYGNGDHPARKTEERRLVEAVTTIIQAGGKVLIPSFALGRAQEIIMILLSYMQSGIIPDFPILTDGLVNKICDVYEENICFTSQRFQHWAERSPNLFYTPPIRRVRERAREHFLRMDTPYCVIASSGMLVGGASVDYARALAGHPKNAIFLSGYQDAESPGAELQAMQQGDYLTLSNGDALQVNCNVEKFHLSAHSDQGQLIKMIKAANPKQIALAHGNARATQALHGKLFKDFPVTVAINCQLYDTTPKGVREATHRYIETGPPYSVS